MSKHVGILSLPRSGSTVLSLIIGAHPEVTNFGESHWLFKDFKGGRRMDNFCRAHGKGCQVTDGIKRGIKRESHYKTLSGASNTKYICTSNKSWHHYSGTDIWGLDNKFIILYKPLEVWAGSFVGTTKIKNLPKNNCDALWFLLEQYSNYYESLISILSKEKRFRNNYLTVNYNNFTKSPESTMRKIFEFMEIKHDPNSLMFNSYLTSGDANQHPIGGNRKTYISINPDRYQASLNRVYREAKWKTLFAERDVAKLYSDNGYLEILKKLKNLNHIGE